MSTYLSFLGVAILLAVAPGPDTFFTLRASVAGGRSRGLWTTAGILTANVVQAGAVVTGLGAIIAHSQPVFLTIKWIGVAYLIYLGITAIVAALRYSDAGWQNLRRSPVSPFKAARQGFLCNITNPKVLAFNLAILPQFVSENATVAELALYALTLAVVGSLFLLVVVFGAAMFRELISRSAFRRGIDGTVGAVMLGFAGALALESA
ncbi:LysE family translocator [Gordonia amarae]|uniref:LysE family translocator n=2 Tax=Gordonia amarae TaxID=36821 RepID=A0A857LPE5_9ACTN|nr:LysE family translocator [Gordonia amarae]MCS3880103.1 threonine/homoserine/homoserine lactone efflux protein [Gordonia amarae]QHN18474.1 LysE family translocator [Gordonia amarae]QHN22956.1 LysE family translocator [Gordonia amarae]QHN31858.1 LysE family translocator [Gordonia amarae]QHN40605.1 LysE family translocator [Gordonia amarae]